MAAVLVVRRTGPGGFDKLLAMKIILPHLAADRKYVDMFLDEGRIASQIQHPNVVQVFDVGEHEGLPYMVMELLRGQSVARIAKRLAGGGETLPADFWLGVLAQAAEGLHGAHDTRGGDGMPLGIVHRDVSPQNLHVGYDGRVRVLDFGIAASRGKISSTRTGEIKGKFAFLAPEQISRAHPVDRRADLWALGTVAWELLAHERLFAAEDEGATLWNVMNRKPPDLGRRAPHLAPEVVECVMRCLEREPANRLPTAHAFAAVMATAATADREGAGRPEDIARSMQQLFATDRAVEQERLRAATRGGAIAPIQEPEPTSERPMLDTVALRSAAESLAGAVASRRGRRRAWLALGAASLAVAAAAGLLRRGGPEAGSVTTAAPVAAPGPSRAAPPPANSTTRFVTFRVDPRARVVLVDAMRHDERPLRFLLAADQSATVELFGPAGEMVRRTVRAADEGTLLAFGSPARAAGRAAPPARRARHAGPRDDKVSQPATRSAPQADPGRPILANPY